jgi:hypothetical protein
VQLIIRLVLSAKPRCHFERKAPEQSVAVYLTCFDEVKATPENVQHHYLVGGIAAPMVNIATLEASACTITALWSYAGNYASAI